MTVLWCLVGVAVGVGLANIVREVIAELTVDPDASEPVASPDP